jgi:hypothetical protein
MKLLYILITIICSQHLLSQTIRDTIFIYFDDEKAGMKKGEFYHPTRKDNPSEKINESITYFIEEKITKNPLGYDTGYTFYHLNRDKKSYEIFGGKPPLKLIKDTAFLRTVKLLDIAFFRKTDYIKVCKTFEAEDSWEQDVIIFIIDKDEIQDGKVVLREVSFSRPVKI